MEKRVILEIAEKRIKALSTAIDFLSNFDDELLKEDVTVLKSLKSMYQNKKIYELDKISKELYGVNSLNQLTCTIIVAKGVTEVKIYDKSNNLMADLTSISKTSVLLAKRRVKNYTIKQYGIHYEGRWKWSDKK